VQMESKARAQAEAALKERLLERLEKLVRETREELVQERPETISREQATAAIKEAGWTYVGFGFFIPDAEPTVDGYGPNGHEIRAYPSDEGQPPRCEITSMTTGMSLWVEGVPEADRVPWLMRKFEDILIHTELGPGDFVLDLETGEVVPESRAGRA
jgi:hypothetical protein